MRTIRSIRLRVLWLAGLLLVSACGAPYDSGTDGERGAAGGTEPVDAQAASHRVEEIPSWVPVYPGVEPVVLHCDYEEDAWVGSLSYEIPKGLDPVARFFESELEQGGFEVYSKASFGAAWPTRLIKASHPTGCCRVKVKIEGDDGRSTALVKYERSDT